CRPPARSPVCSAGSVPRSPAPPCSPRRVRRWRSPFPPNPATAWPRRCRSASLRRRAPSGPR
ncbi:MAG: hypothetical protein AVDCRST_MAG40-861, partial [uncultured Gemmatimonadaceae bacterium]